MKKQRKIIITASVILMIAALAAGVFFLIRREKDKSDCDNLSHEWGAWDSVKDSTCTEIGTLKRACTLCGESETRASLPLAHVLSDWTDNGMGEYVKTCNLCQETVASERMYSYYSEGLTFERDPRSDHCSVAGIGGCTDAVIVIPTEVGGLPVTEIKHEAFKDCKGIEAVIIPDTVTKIGSDAFYGSSVKRIFIPDEVTTIGNGAFAYCSTLTELILPNSLKKLGTSILTGTRNIENVIIPSGLTVIPASAFAYSSVKSLALPEGIEKIADDAFTNCISLTEISLPHTLREIGSGAFSECLSLTDMFLPDGITHIGKEAFADCAALASVNIPAGVTSLSSGVFMNCKALKKIYFNANLRAVDGSSFLGINLAETELFIPKNSKNFYLLGSSLIGKNPDTVVIGSADGSIPTDKNITRIGNAAFIDRRDLTHIVIPKNITHIGGGAFSGCVNLTGISYEGTVAEWEEVSLGVVWYNGYGVKSVKCSDGEAKIEFEK